MAINKRTEVTESLHTTLARPAGVFSAVLAIAGMAVTVLYLRSLSPLPALLTVLGVAKIVLGAILVIAGVQLIRGQSWAQRFLLVVILAWLVATVSLTVAALLWGPPSWWPENFSPFKILPLMALLQIVAVILLVAASAPGSRLRYATNVTCSIAAALALLFAANMLAQADYVRRDVETLQRYALSPRMQKIVQAVDQPLRLSCVYTSDEPDDETPVRRARIMDLFEEIHELNRGIQIAHITTDTDKARLVERLRKRLGGQAQEHLKLLNDFTRIADELADALETDQQQWRQGKPESYLNQWGLTVEVARVLEQQAKDLRRTAQNVRGDLTGSGLPDYEQLAEQVRQNLQISSETFNTINTELAKIAEIAPAVRANRQAIQTQATESQKAVAELLEILGPADATPDDPAEVLAKAAAASAQAAQHVTQTLRQLKEIAGPDQMRYVQASQSWIIQDDSPSHAVLPGGMMIELGRKTVSDLYAAAAEKLQETNTVADTYLRAAKPEFQHKSISQLREQTVALAASLATATEAAEKAFDALSQPDADSQALLQLAKDNQAFQNIRQPIDVLREQIDALPEIESDSGQGDLTQDNIVIVETDQAAAVVDFESVWPLRVRSLAAATGSSEARTFDGDAAISSKILTLTHEPFATVLLATYQPTLPPQMAQMIPPADISPANLTTLQRRIEQANFEVKQWNLTEPRPEADPDRPQVLIILPPAPTPSMPMGGEKLQSFGEEHLSKIRQAIDEGLPALFLAQWAVPHQMSPWTPPVSPPYPMNTYLQEDWGLRVLTDYVVIPAVPDPNQPGKYKIDPMRFTHLPLNTYSDHPIGRPLQAQRTLWPQVAPVQIAGDVPEGVSVEPLLTVPANWQTTWATGRFEALVAQFLSEEGSFVSPDYAAGDIHVPFDVAFTAARDKSDAAKPSRIVVLGTSGGLVDGYLDQRVGVLEQGAIRLDDPPRANADLVTNSLYWLIGREHYIARGPAQIQPIAMIPPATMRTLWALCVVALPLAILGLGGIVLLGRRR